MKARSILSLGLGVLVGFSACADDGDRVLGPISPPSASISDAVHEEGNPHFYFLPPMVSQPTYSGVFDGSQEPVVEICEWTGSACVEPLLARYTTTSGPGSETVRVVPGDKQYIVSWHTDQSGLNLEKTYRIRVTVAGTELGHADVDVASTGKELKNLETGASIPLLDGRTLPIKFRIENDAVFVVGPGGGTFVAADGSVTMVVAPDALATEVGITVQPVPYAELPADVGLVDGAVFDFQPGGLEFAVPVELTVTYDDVNLPAGLDETTLTLLTEDGGVWDELAGTTVNPVANTITGFIDGFSKKGGGAAAFVEVTPASASLEIDETVQLIASVTNSAGNPLSRPVHWSSSDDAVATVDNTGLATAVDAGSASITARAGQAEAGAEITVAPPVFLAYVTSLSTIGVAVFETPSNTLVATIPTGSPAKYIAAAPDNQHLYVANLAGDIAVIETASNTIVARVPIGRGMGVAVTPDGDHVYAGHQYNATVHKISTATNTVVNAINVGAGTLYMAIRPDGAYGYASHDWGNKVSLIDLATDTHVGNITVGSRPRAIAFTLDGAFAYVANIISHTVSVVETASHTAVATIPVGSNPHGLEITPDGRFIYVTNSAYPAAASVSVIETSSNTVVATIPVDDQPYELGITPDGAFVYVSHPAPSTISVIETASNTVVASFPSLAPSDIVLIPRPSP